MEFAFILAGFFLMITIIFVAVAAFFPEMVGIQGKVAKQFENDQSGKSDEPSKPE